MSLTPGTRLGPYEIAAQIGVGGMGEVYRATDTKLKRQVAIKVLPESLAADPDRLARFQREAEVLASLNHPNIAAIYGIEDTTGAKALVMELVEGPTLADRIAQGPMPLDETLGIARQIADALQAAHDLGVIHRDLKPANIKLRRDGAVKVLDFGLAKMLDPKPAGGALSNSPTMLASMPGLLLGTAAYMSPEQAKGQEADRRADVWAFGCVLVEMLTGRAAFEGATMSEILASVLKTDPDWRRLPAGTPEAIRRLLRRCLQKDDKLRLRDIGDARLEIEEALEDPGRAGQVGSLVREGVSSPRTGRRAFWSSLGAVTLVIGVAVWNVARTPRSSALAVAQVVVPVPRGDREVGELRHPVFAISPDGARLVYVQHPPGGSSTQLYQRVFDQREFKPMPGTEGGERPFFSPDGQWVGFLADGRVKKVPVSGGPPVVLCELAGFQAATWGAGDVIVVAQDSRTGLGLVRVSANGGVPQTVTRVDPAKGEAAHAWPQFLPGGKAVLFSIRSVSGSWDDAQIAVQALETGERRVVIRGGTQPRYAPSGHLVYARAGTLMAVPFDAARLTVAGTPVPILEEVSYHRSQMADAMQFSFSDLSGSLIYLAASQISDVGRLVWVDRTGQAQPLTAPPRPYQWPRLSPEGQRIAVTIQAATNDIWVYDLTRETLSRLTFDTQNDFQIWTPDGTRVTFTSYRAGAVDLFSKIADPSGAEERLTTGDSALSWSPDGRVLLFSQGGDVWILPMDGDRKPRPFFQTPFVDGYARFSPDGRWVAYLSNESGHNEVYVQPFQGPGEKKQISTDGGTEPVWARNGRELFYRNADKMMAVEVTTSPSFMAGKPRLLFEKPYVRVSTRPNYDVTPDGRFLMLQQIEASAPMYLNVVQNWTEELTRLVPTK